MNPTKNREKMIEVSFVSLLVTYTVPVHSLAHIHSLLLVIIALCFVVVFVQVMFEEYQCAGVYIAIQAVLTLYAQGKSRDHHMVIL